MADRYSGPERRRFRRLELHYPVKLESYAGYKAEPELVVEGMTVNLSFGGALVGVSDSAGLHGATPVKLRFVETDVALPAAMSAVVWRLEARDARRERHVALEFEAPLVGYAGAIELADRLEWLRNMGGQEFVDDIVEKFLFDAPEALRSIRRRNDEGDLAAVAQLCRSLKASAGNVGAVNLYEVSRRAEHAARVGDAATAQRYVDALQDYFESARVQLEESP